MSRQANFSTHQGACSLISNQFDMTEQNLGAKVMLRNIFFSLEIYRADEGALLRESVAGASSLVCTGL